MERGGKEKHRNERCGKIVIDFPFGARLPNRSNERFPVWQFFIWHYCIAPTIHFHWIDIQSKCKYLYVSSIQSSPIVISALLSITDFSTFQSGRAQALCVYWLCVSFIPLVVHVFQLPATFVHLWIKSIPNWCFESFFALRYHDELNRWDFD